MSKETLKQKLESAKGRASDTIRQAVEEAMLRFHRETGLFMTDVRVEVMFHSGISGVDDAAISEVGISYE